jgi:Methyltransferase domain
MLREALPFGPVEYWGFDLFERTTPDVAKTEASAFVPVSREDVQARLSFPGTSVHLIPGDSTLTVPKADIPSADLVFIDGGHSYRTVRSDWDNIQRLIHGRTVIFFDDYTNDVGVQEGYGVKQVVDGLDRQDWTVDILQPRDRFRRPAGVLEAQLVRVRPATAPALQ